ncbi:MAG: hypothetical protein OXD44_05690 [Gammaproteobacteria bacterium]|nr:hypothetical protein [Gammaproteobacteria bacterium]MCY4227661.1 hypothetical protein [Gammaproteobacteria bacterium]MCY4313177.1 hypothetical protein [Gammaproteobacteria bacterium]
MKQPIRAGEVAVRLAKTREIPWRDRPMRKHHVLDFKRFAGRDLRYVCEHQGQWIALRRWQRGAPLF